MAKIVASAQKNWKEGKAIKTKQIGKARKTKERASFCSRILSIRQFRCIFGSGDVDI